MYLVVLHIWNIRQALFVVVERGLSVVLPAISVSVCLCCIERKRGLNPASSCAYIKSRVVSESISTFCICVCCSRLRGTKESQTDFVIHITTKIRAPTMSDMIRWEFSTFPTECWQAFRFARHYIEI